MNSFINDLKLKFQTGNIVIKFIYLTLFIEFFTTIIEAFFFKNNKGYIYDLLSLDASFLSFLAFPFSLFTYVFVNDSIFSLIANLFFLFYISNLFLSYFREKDLITFSILGILGSGILFQFLSLFLNGFHSLVGLKPLLFCLLFAVIAYRPLFYLKIMFVSFPLQLKYIGFFFLGIEFLSWIGDYNNITSLVSLGAAAMGYFYMKQFEIGNDFLGKLLLNITPTKKPLNKKFFKNPPKDDFKFQDRKAKKQEFLNAILEKISLKGYDSLTEVEKEFLNKKSQE